MDELRDARLDAAQLEQLRLWIWEQIGKGGDDLIAVQPTLDFVLNKIEDIQSAAGSSQTSRQAVVGPSGKTDAEVLNSIVLPMVRERSLKTGDTWDQASNALEAAISAYTHPAPTRAEVLEDALRNCAIIPRKTP